MRSLAGFRWPVGDHAVQRGDTLIISGWYGTETIGDQAILAGLLSLVPSDVDEVVVASLEPYVTERTLELLGAPSTVSTMSYRAARSLVSKGRARAVAMGGGPVMGTIPQIRTLAALHRAAHRRGVPTGFLGSGIGPVGHGSRKRIVREVMRAADVVALRDAKSAADFRALTGREAALSGDPSLVWLAETGEENRGPLEHVDRNLRIGLALRSWPIHEYGDGAVGPKDRTRLEQELGIFVESARARARAELVPVPMGFLHKGGDDRRELREILGPITPETQLIEYPEPSSIRSRVAGCDVVVAMRFHGALFALAAGTRVVAIDYTLGGKVAALKEMFPGSVHLLDPRVLRSDDIWAAVEGLMEEGVRPTGDDHANTARRVLMRAIERLLA